MNKTSPCKIETCSMDPLRKALLDGHCTQNRKPIYPQLLDVKGEENDRIDTVYNRVPKPTAAIIETAENSDVESDTLLDAVCWKSLLRSTIDDWRGGHLFVPPLRLLISLKWTHSYMRTPTTIFHLSSHFFETWSWSAAVTSSTSWIAPRMKSRVRWKKLLVLILVWSALGWKTLHLKSTGIQKLSLRTLKAIKLRYDRRSISDRSTVIARSRGTAG